MLERLFKGNSIVINLDSTERGVSVVGGILMVLYGLIRLPLAAVVALVGGAYFLYRGWRGYCPVYAAVGIDHTVSYVETAEFPHRPFSNRPPESVRQSDEVTEASWESFPTSDPPAWTMGRSN